MNEINNFGCLPNHIRTHIHTQYVIIMACAVPTDFGVFAILLNFIYPDSAQKIAAHVCVSVCVCYIIWRSN